MPSAFLGGMLFLAYLSIYSRLYNKNVWVFRSCDGYSGRGRSLTITIPIPARWPGGLPLRFWVACAGAVPVAVRTPKGPMPRVRFNPRATHAIRNGFTLVPQIPTALVRGVPRRGSHGTTAW